MPSENRPVERSTDLRALLAALAVLALLVGFVHACGSDDLIFPGDVPATATAEFTQTPTPNDG